MNDRTTAEQQPCILVVEDNKDMNMMLAQLLERAGYQVVLAGDGQTALTQAKQHHPDLILMDLSLPDIDGWQAVGLLRKMPEFRDTPIIAATAHVSAADQARALAVGCTVHIGKPFKTRSLLHTIEQLLKDGENGHAS
jgi:two-component system, cell cycle response regulator DivK